MSTLAKLFLLLRFITSKLSICANTGFMAGAIAGFFLGLEDAVSANFPLATFQDVLIDSLLLTAMAWIAVLFVLCVTARLSFSSVALPSLINCFLTCLLTTWICNKFSLFRWAWLVGMLVGIFVGTLLCRLNQIFSPTK
jgi:hypothetical protein